MPLNMADFWVQIHDFPLGLMTVSMAEQFGNFVEKFIDYDTSFSPLGFQTFMRIRVCLDVSKLLRRKKKILIGNDRITYARFQYEKLSLFCFICGKLGHGESFCPLRTVVELSKIVFGWDITLRAAVRRQNVTASKWLREADGSEYGILNKARTFRGFNPTDNKDSERNLGGVLAEGYFNPNLIPIGFNYAAVIEGNVKWPARNLREVGGADSGLGPMDLQADEENDLIVSLEGKKRQRVANVPVYPSGHSSIEGNFDISANSASQSSRPQ